MAGRRRGPGLSLDRILCTSCPSINSTTEEKVLPNTCKEEEVVDIKNKSHSHLGKLGGIGGVPGEGVGEGVAEEEQPLLALLDLPLLLLPPQTPAPAQEPGQGRSRGHHALPTVEEEKAEGGVERES